MVAAVLAVVSIAGCTTISGTLTWNKGAIAVPSPIIGALGVPNPTLQDEIKLQAYQRTQDGSWLQVGRVTYGKVSIVGREVSVPYYIDNLPLATPTSGSIIIDIETRPKPRGAFFHGPYNPEDGIAYNPSDRINWVVLTSRVPMVTGFDLTYYESIASFGTGRKQQLKKFQSHKRHI
jgi:hypothetical protein